MFSKFILRFILKYSWSQGAKAPKGVPRLTGEEMRAVTSKMAAGDCLLIGGATSLSHVAVYVGDGVIIHSVGTEKTMRGRFGSFIDALIRPFRWLMGQRDVAGVIEERLDDFVERFERHSYVGLRWDALKPEGVQAGIDHIRGLVGKPYDYDFNLGDDEYYCTEIAMEFLQRAGGELPRIDTRIVHIPLLMKEEVVDPDALLKSTDLRPTVCNQAALTHYEALLTDVPMLD